LADLIVRVEPHQIIEADPDTAHVHRHPRRSTHSRAYSPADRGDADTGTDQVAAMAATVVATAVSRG
jgi:hypothetical protein